MSDRLSQLLRAADAPPPTAAGDLVQRVQRRRTRERTTRRAIAASVLLLALCLPWVTRLRSPVQPVVIAPAPSVAVVTPPTPAAVAALDAEARLHEQVADRLLASSSRGRRGAQTKSPHDPALAELQQQRDRAALLLVYEADQYRQRNQPIDAVASYRRAIELFPQTHWADVARQRLKDL